MVLNVGRKCRYVALNFKVIYLYSVSTWFLLVYEIPSINKSIEKMPRNVCIIYLTFWGSLLIGPFCPIIFFPGYPFASSFSFSFFLWLGFSKQFMRQSPSNKSIWWFLSFLLHLFSFLFLPLYLIEH